MDSLEILQQQEFPSLSQAIIIKCHMQLMLA